MWRRLNTEALRLAPGPSNHGNIGLRNRHFLDRIMGSHMQPDSSEKDLLLVFVMRRKVTLTFPLTLQSGRYSNGMFFLFLFFYYDVTLLTLLTIILSGFVLSVVMCSLLQQQETMSLVIVHMMNSCGQKVPNHYLFHAGVPFVRFGRRLVTIFVYDASVRIHVQSVLSSRTNSVTYLLPPGNR